MNFEDRRRMTGQKSEIERLKSEVARYRKERATALRCLKAAEQTASTWQKKVVTVAEHYRRRINQLRSWAEKLSGERQRLADEVARLETEKQTHLGIDADFRCDAIARFLENALEKAPARDRHRLIYRP